MIKTKKKLKKPLWKLNIKLKVKVKIKFFFFKKITRKRVFSPHLTAIFAQFKPIGVFDTYECRYVVTMIFHASTNKLIDEKNHFLRVSFLSFLPHVPYSSRCSLISPSFHLRTVIIEQYRFKKYDKLLHYG